MAMLALPAPEWREFPGGAPRAPRTAAERDGLIEALDDPVDWPTAAAALLAHLGFRLVEPEGADRASHLLIALRDRPTLEHFDPELVAYYAPTDFGATLTTFGRTELEPLGMRDGRPALWGHVHVIDRVPVENRYLTFGGDLRIAAVTSGLTVVDLASPAPIVRWGGHSQGTDDLATAIGAFFSRVIVPVNFVPGIVALVDGVPPGVLYRAFLADALRRTSAAEHHGAERTRLGAWIAAAWRRARRDEASCDAAGRLLRALGFDDRST